MTRWMGWAATAALLGLLACDDDGGATLPAAQPDCGAVQACGPDDGPVVDLGPDEGPDMAPVEPGAAAVFEPDFDRADPAQFFRFPYPSDARLTADGRPDLDALPDPHQIGLIRGVLDTAGDRLGFPTVPVAWFKFDGPLGELPADQVWDGTDAPLMLLDIDPDSPDVGRTVPVIAQALAPDDYVPEHVLAVAPRPGFVLRAENTYAVVIRTSLVDRDGRPLAVPPAFAALAEGGGDGPLAALYAPLWPALEAAGVPRGQVAVATVFTTGDVVAGLYALTELIRRDFDADINRLQRRPDLDEDRFCVLRGLMEVAQFQAGEAPFDTEGLFEFDAEGLPVPQRLENVPIGVAIPRQPMPPEGYPLALYFHGSGGVSMQFVDAGPQGADGIPAAGRGPAWVFAEHGLASAGSAHPVSPERVPGASGIAYLNFANLAAFRDTFRQGVVEQRLYLDALLDLRIDPAELADCEGVSVPDGVDAIRFDPEKVIGQGQSMGGMYTNLIGAVEPRLKALVPTGAGGFWTYFILETSLIPNTPRLLSSLLRTGGDLTHLHPVMHAAQTAWEVSDPMVSMPRLSLRPLPGFPVRPIYEPVGKDDEYFPPQVFDAMVLAYRHPMAGDEVWPQMQGALALAGLDGILDYPVVNNLTSEDGRAYTGVAVQYEGDAFGDPHQIYRQLDAVKYQYGCFLKTFLQTGTATVPAPAPLGTPCPGLE